MAKKAVNHPPTPAVESPTDPGSGVDCEALKVKYGIDVNTYSKHKKVKSKKNNSHHILQNATVEEYISKGEGLCVLLGNAHSGTPHQITTARQNERRDNKKNGTPGAMPATNVGELKDLSKGDLTESFKKQGIPEPDASDLADCLVKEAEKQMKKAAKRDEDTDVDDDSSVEETGGCFPARTLIWLDHHVRRHITGVTSSDSIAGLARTRPVVRRDWCMSRLIRLQLRHDVIALAPFHRVLTADGRYRRADALRAGMAVRTDTGTDTIVRVQRHLTPRRIHSVGVGEAFECRIGRSGVWVELPNTGVPVTRTVRLVRFRARIRRAWRARELRFER
jgi:hypothetical protein